VGKAEGEGKKLGREGETLANKGFCLASSLIVTTKFYLLVLVRDLAYCMHQIFNNVIQHTLWQKSWLRLYS